jgi:hypothetical protein
MHPYDENEDRKTRKQKRLAEFLANFDALPNDALARDLEAAAILGTSVWTLQRTNPVPARKISERVRGRRVGDLRRFMRGEPVTA